MRVSNEEVAVLRALLSGDDQDAWTDHSRALLQAGEGRGYDHLTYATFTILVRRKFSPTWKRSDIVRWVASLRAKLVGYGEVIDPVVAEHLIQGILGDVRINESDDNSRDYALLVLTITLADGEELNTAELDNLLSSARKMVDLGFPENGYQARSSSVPVGGVSDPPTKPTRAASRAAAQQQGSGS